MYWSTELPYQRSSSRENDSGDRHGSRLRPAPTLWPLTHGEKDGFSAASFSGRATRLRVGAAHIFERCSAARHQRFAPYHLAGLVPLGFLLSAGFVVVRHMKRLGIGLPFGLQSCRLTLRPRPSACCCQCLCRDLEPNALRLCAEETCGTRRSWATTRIHEARMTVQNSRMPTLRVPALALSGSSVPPLAHTLLVQKCRVARLYQLCVKLANRAGSPNTSTLMATAPARCNLSNSFTLAVNCHAERCASAGQHSPLRP